MTYITGGTVQATDYNTFATLAGSMNEIYADLHPGATTLPDAGFGYGQNPLTSVTIGSNIRASEWAALFQSMRASGTHQGVNTVPPLPATDPVPGDLIEAFTTPTTLAALVTSLQASRFNVALGESSLVAGTLYTQPVVPWINTLVWTVSVNLSSWNNARYFFNSGGSILLTGTYPAPVTPEDIQWNSMLSAMSPLAFNAFTSSPSSGSGGTAIGFYGLTASYQTIYTKTYGGAGSYSYYSNSYINVEAKLNSAAGTSGLLDFRISLVDEDPNPTAKILATTYQMSYIKSTGAVVYPGPAVIVTPVGANSGFTAT